MRENPLRAKLAQGQLVVGTFVHYPSPALVEVAGLLGFDWVFIDAEHGPMSVETCEELVRAAECASIVPLIRLPRPEPGLIGRFLDVGAMGVLVPHLNSRARAEAIVAAAKYRPLGRRGSGHNTRAGRYGFGLSSAAYAQWANAETLVFGILEDADVVAELPEILKVEGLDGFVIGPSDLSHSLGFPGEINHPRVSEVVAHITSMVLASDKHLCRVVLNAARAKEEARTYLDLGVRMVAHSLLSFLGAAVRDFMTIRAAGPR